MRNRFSHLGKFDGLEARRGGSAKKGIEPQAQFSRTAGEVLSWFTVKWNRRLLALASRETHPAARVAASCAKVCRVRANPGAEREERDRIQRIRPRLRFWPLGRRSGCSSAEPYPPPRSTRGCIAAPSRVQATRGSFTQSSIGPAWRAAWRSCRRSSRASSSLRSRSAKDLGIQAVQLVGRRDIAQRRVQPLVVIALDERPHLPPRLLRRWPDMQAGCIPA